MKNGNAGKKIMIPKGANSGDLIRMAVICLAIVSLYTTAQGMKQYIFDGNNISYLASAAIQSILLAMSMGLPGYLNGVWKNQWHVVMRLLVCICILTLTVIIMFCSSFFSYIYIAEFVNKDSWGTESELLVQQTYRKELYQAKDYAHAYRTYLEMDMGEKLLILQQQADEISQNEKLDNLNMDWDQERINYGDVSTSVGVIMAPVIDAMENAMKSSSAQGSREQAAIAVTDAINNVESGKESIQQELDRLDLQINNINLQINSLTRMINNATEETNIESLNNTLNNYVQQRESVTNTQNAKQEEYGQLDAALTRLQIYENRLGLNNSASSISIRNKLLEMQKQFFQNNPDEEQLLDEATSIFDELRNSEIYGEDNLSYTESLVQMNQLILNLKDYSNIKKTESTLESMIEELKSDAASETKDNIQGEEDADTEWEKIWKERLESLRAQISSMPEYMDEYKTNDNETNILTDSQSGILRTYEKNESTNQLDEMIRMYIEKHNALYQGLIYLNSPYRMLAIFSFVLAVLFDLSGFILGFISWSNKNVNSSTNNVVGSVIQQQIESRRDQVAEWSIIPAMNIYMILTGDYEKKDGVFIYQTFENGLPREWLVQDTLPYICGIYVQDTMVETKGSPVNALEVDIAFAEQTGGPKDGIYLDGYLEYNDGSLLLVKKNGNIEIKKYLANVNEYVPVHCYSPFKGESQTIPIVELETSQIDAQMIVLALNEMGTRIAAIYIMEK